MTQTFVGWVHITCAAVVAGGLLFWLLALRPAEEAAPIARFRPVFWAAAAMLLLTGLFTWILRMQEGRPHTYLHGLYLKLILYVALFGIAGPLVRRAAAGKSGPAARRWLTVCCLIALGILYLSATLRRIPPRPNHPGTTAPATAVIDRGGVQS